MAGKSSRIPAPMLLIETSDERTGTSFFLAASIHATALGYWGERTVRRAMERVLAKAEPSKLNCLEITEVSTRQFLGFLYVHVSAHSRHIQKSPFLQELAGRAEP